jgi:hypothetical protein
MKRRSHLRDLGIDGRKIFKRKQGDLIQNRVQWLALVNTVMNLKKSKKK